MQLRLLALLLLQPERGWTLQELSEAVAGPPSSVHRELRRAEAAGLIRPERAARPHRFYAATEDPLFEPLAELLRRAVGVEQDLRAALDHPGVLAASLYGSWVDGPRRPNSDIDVLVVGDASLRELRSRVRPVGKATGRTIDVTLLAPDEFQRMLSEQSSFARQIAHGRTVPLIGDLSSLGPE
jgi:predicted nucleotidyltransferase